MVSEFQRIYFLARKVGEASVIIRNFQEATSTRNKVPDYASLLATRKLAGDWLRSMKARQKRLQKEK
ncbi:MAG: hypothetical protein UT24_C0003G0024 [Candidatus Woesebacteria bacterium GW2011_GWB1_39_12]|uniref:Uncharacterized protein n=1 Tax=Candidatus Woesebacteria bacterium GW2011_GWB1_39_12 TaxID=1618574 RepID=A0A0G0QIW6_9BACT|nr:MAG: hypothetical protein UT24_C0003G0024 [Candidatus Woesebacteria bacterium GW2011_GWB1_39_12]